jgi:hypothetical protein
LFFIFRRDLIRRRSLNSVLINAYFFAVYFEFIGIKHSVISRFALLFLIAPLLALLPDLILVIIQKIRDKFGSRPYVSQGKPRVLSILAVAAFCIYGLTVHALLLSNNYNGVVPYQTIFNYSITEVSR